jgi:hypothetical protein
MKKEEIWRWIERLVLVGTILGMLLNNKLKDAVWKTEVDMKLETLIENDEKQEKRMSNENDINDLILDYLRYRDNWTRPSEEEDSEGG